MGREKRKRRDGKVEGKRGGEEEQRTPPLEIPNPLLRRDSHANVHVDHFVDHWTKILRPAQYV